jgi:transcriptional regulator with XRE-family HTH domain
VVPIADVESLTEVNIAFGRFVRLMRRKKRLTLEELSEHADVEISELVEVEDDARHKPDPRTVFQLSKVFNIPTSKLMQVAGLSVPRDARLVHEAIRFAARSEPLDELTEAERAALDAFVSVLGNQS